MFVCSSINSLFFGFTSIEAWQLLQGKIPSVIGGGGTGNSSVAFGIEEVKKDSVIRKRPTKKIVFHIDELTLSPHHATEGGV